MYSSKGVSAINHSEAAALRKVTELCSARPKPWTYIIADWREESFPSLINLMVSVDVKHHVYFRGEHGHCLSDSVQHSS